MVTIDVRKLNAERHYSGKVEFSLPADDSLVLLPMASMASGIEAQGTYQIFEDDSVEIRGYVQYCLQGSCSRCLKPAQKRIEAEWAPLFVKGESDGETYPYANDIIRPDDSIRDAVMLSMPYSLLCSEDCPGIPYDSGENRSTDSLTFQKEEVKKNGGSQM